MEKKELFKIPFCTACILSVCAAHHYFLQAPFVPKSICANLSHKESPQKPLQLCFLSQYSSLDQLFNLLVHLQRFYIKKKKLGTWFRFPYCSQGEEMREGEREGSGGREFIFIHIYMYAHSGQDKEQKQILGHNENICLLTFLKLGTI